MALSGWREAVRGHRKAELAGLAARDHTVTDSVVCEVRCATVCATASARN